MDVLAYQELTQGAQRRANGAARPARPSQTTFASPMALQKFTAGMRARGSTEAGIAWLLSSDA